MQNVNNAKNIKNDKYVICQMQNVKNVKREMTVVKNIKPMPKMLNGLSQPWVPRGTAFPRVPLGFLESPMASVGLPSLFSGSKVKNDKKSQMSKISNECKQK
jgi:hypothetical protein